MKKSEQEKFWSGDFGQEYTQRHINIGFKNRIPKNISLFSKILSKTSNIKSIFEFGANMGINLYALKILFPITDISALEINSTAVTELKKIENIKVYHQSILDYIPDYQRDFIFTSGVLIHIAPEKLQKVYEIMYKSSRKYICIIEYYNPTPVEVEYRGHKNKLFKRDFAGELLDKYKDLKLIDYGFVYHRDNNFPLDDVTWFLLEKF